MAETNETQEETKVTPIKKTARKKTTTKKKDYSKTMKQETFTAKSGNKYLFTYPGTFYVQKNVKDASNIGGYESKALLHQALMKYILEGDYDYDFFDKQIKGEDKTNSVEVEDHDGSKIEYSFKFPGLERLDNMVEDSKTVSGGIAMSEYNQQVMQHVLVSPNIKFDYWDHHDGYSTTMQAADVFLGTVSTESDFDEVMEAANDFVNRMFR